MRLLRRSDEEQPPAPADSEAVAPEEPAVHEERLREWQPRLYLKLVLLLATLGYAVAFVLENRKSVGVHFVFATEHVSLIWVILLSIALGLLGGVLVSQLYRRRRRRN